MVFRFTGIEVGIEGLRPYSSLDEYGKPLPKGWRKVESINPAGKSMYKNVYTETYDNPDLLISWIPKKEASKITDFSPDLHRKHGQATLPQPHGSSLHFRKEDAADHIPKLPGKYPILEHIWATQVLPIPVQGPEEAYPVLIPPSLHMKKLDKLRLKALKADKKKSGQSARGAWRKGKSGKGLELVAELSGPEPPPSSTVIWNGGYIGKNHNHPELFGKVLN